MPTLYFMQYLLGKEWRPSRGPLAFRLSPDETLQAATGLRTGCDLAHAV